MIIERLRRVPRRRARVAGGGGEGGAKDSEAHSPRDSEGRNSRCEFMALFAFMTRRDERGDFCRKDKALARCSPIHGQRLLKH